jgi:hypothetical protein
MNNKPTFRAFYGKNSIWLLVFLIGSNLLFWTLYAVNWFDKLSAVIWFWISAGIFVISIIGSLIHYNKTYPK